MAITAIVDTVNTDNLQSVANMGDGVPTRESYHHGDLRTALIAEGLRQLESGGSEISLRALAKAAGVSPNAPYRHFADRNALMGALAAEGFSEFTEAIVAALRDGQERDALMALGRAYLGFARDHPALYRLMFSPYGYSLDHSECKAAAERAFGVLYGAVSRAHAAGWKPDQAPLTLTLAFWAVLHGWACLTGDKLMPPGVAGADWDALLMAFLA